ncbi:MAG: hypothetical protein QME12_03185 [Nanoarchaeota archaeon]|nr:hypothetical protein [Nanoarchaeota archaeon]
MTNKERSYEELKARGEILEECEVVIEEEEAEIPVYVEEDLIDRGMLPEVAEFAPGKAKVTPLPFAAHDKAPDIDRSRLPDLVIYRGPPPKASNRQVPAYDMANICSASSVKVSDAQKRLEELAERLLGEENAGSRLARFLGRTTERGRLNAFGNYFAEFLRNSSTGYISPEQFLVKAEMALINLKAGAEGGRPIRKSIREALAGKNKAVYDSIRQKLPEIARAVATTRFAMEIRQIYIDAGRAGRSAFDYANDIKRERQIDNIARMLIREGLK